MKDIPDVPSPSEEVDETTEVDEVPTGNSYGQSAGLKDDLDVDDDGVGNTNILLCYTVEFDS